ncbi:hypothetical protein EAS64_16240 [Trebonia kvetii]|uniref:Uncharacterized protein n=1 Tax=Trebonia kvetii TaxID=2480626 RepID=A0A6P2C0H2_9ACTN|nr:hypothetical protein [Trebonia kvetii]TVZ03975.1 hypothetical protein EAS64_16240 [Trebonia kvetii]
MRVTFPRLADHQRAYAVIERDDGVVYQLFGGTAGPGLSHDIRHLIVERELRISDGIWGAIAAGVVYESMRHLSGRRPPHAADRSAELKRTQRNRVMRAELLANLVEAVAVLDDQSPDRIMRLTREKLSVVPIVEPGMDPGEVIAVPPPQALLTAARALQVEAARWARLRVGEALVYEWRCPLRSLRKASGAAG